MKLTCQYRPGSSEPLEFDIVDHTSTPDVARAEDELDSDLTAALHGLTDIERTAFVLKHLEQWRLREIAAELDTTVGTIKQALFRGVKKLRISMVHLRSAS